MLTIGHRGLKDEFPENTALAVREAAPLVDVVEIDVRPCGSGELVARHDDELAETTDSDGLVSETSLDDLRETTVQGSDEPIPSFEELLRDWPADTGINVDVKGATDVTSLLERLATAAVDGPVILSVDDVTLSTFDPGATDVAVGLSFWRDPAENVRRAAAAGCDYVHVHEQICLETDVVERAHDADLAVDAWSIDDRETAAELAGIDVDAITVNRRDAIP